MSAMIENEIIDLVKQLDENRQRQVLDYVRQLDITEKPRLTALDIMQLPSEERERIVAESFALAADEDFEIFLP